MTEYVKTILTGQFDASLCMLNKCVEMCPEDHWEGKIANDTFRQVAYHTLFWLDCYLSANEVAFTLRNLHNQGGDERVNTTASAGLNKEETLAYILICRKKVIETLAAETRESLEGESGFCRLAFSRGELHLYNIRHAQHHTGQLSAYLRRIVKDGEGWWIKTGWHGTKKTDSSQCL